MIPDLVLYIKKTNCSQLQSGMWFAASILILKQLYHNSLYSYDNFLYNAKCEQNNFENV